MCEAGLLSDIECIGVIHAKTALFNRDSVNFDIDKNLEVYLENFEYKQTEKITVKDTKKVPVLTRSDERCKALH